jgi:hypothetical protein
MQGSVSKSDARELLVLVSVGLLLGSLTAPPDATTRAVVASGVLGAAGCLLVGALTICVRMYRKDRRKKP